MPIALKHDVSPSASWLLWEIEETEDWFLQNLTLTPLELAELQTIVVDHRRLELLAGRMAAQTLCKTLGMPYHGIGKLETGKPILVKNSSELSLSHSFPFAVAYIHQYQAVGIDLDSPREKMLKVAPRVLNEIELKHANNDLYKICQYWCAKEVLYKIYAERGLVFKDDMQVNLSDVGIVGIIKKNGFFVEYPIEFYRFKSHFLCYNT